MTMAWPSRNINQTIDIGAAQGRVQKYFVNGTAADLRRQFEIETRDDGAGRPGAYYVSMVPKRKQIRETLAQLGTLGRSHVAAARCNEDDVRERRHEDHDVRGRRRQRTARRPHVQPRSVAVLAKNAATSAEGASVYSPR